MSCINGCMVISNLVISLVPYEEAKKNKNKQQQKAFIYQNCLRIFAHFQWMRGEKVPRESKKCPGTLWGFSSIFVRAHKDSSRCCQAESLGLLPLSPPSLLFLSSVFALWHYRLQSFKQAMTEAEIFTIGRSRIISYEKFGLWPITKAVADCLILKDIYIYIYSPPVLFVGLTQLN